MFSMFFDKKLFASISAFVFCALINTRIRFAAALPKDIDRFLSGKESGK